jgi:hypothetical protein
MLVAKNEKTELALLPALADRPGLITERTVDRESAYEKLKTQVQEKQPTAPNPVSDILFGKTGPRGGRRR